MCVQTIILAFVLTLLLPLVTVAKPDDTSEDTAKVVSKIDSSSTDSFDSTQTSGMNLREVIHIDVGHSEIHVPTIYNLVSKDSEQYEGNRWNWHGPSAIGLYTAFLIALSVFVAWKTFTRSIRPILQLGIEEKTYNPVIQMKVDNVSSADVVGLVQLDIYYNGTLVKPPIVQYNHDRYWQLPAKLPFTGVVSLPSVGCLAQCTDVRIKAEVHYRSMPRRTRLRRFLFRLYSWRREYIYSTPTLEWKLKLFIHPGATPYARWVPEIVSEKIQARILKDDSMLKSWPFED